MGLLAVLLTSSAAQAATIQFQFTGTVRSVSDSLLADFSLGESVVGTVTIDDADSIPQLAELGGYAASDLTVTFGGDYTLMGSVGGGNVFDSFIDVFDVDFYPGDVIGPRTTQGRPDSFTLSLTFRASALASDALPLSLPLHLVQSQGSHVLFGGDPAHRLGFSVDSVATVPEPTTGLLLLTGLLGLAGWRREWP